MEQSTEHENTDDVTPNTPPTPTHDVGESVANPITETVGTPDSKPSAMSPNISAALCEMQKCELGAITDSKNPFFNSKYADLTSVWGVIRKPLTENGLAIMQYTEPREGGITVVTRLCHTSGDMFETRLSGKTTLDKHGKATVQGLGSLITYLRRYSISALVGVCPVDDDAEVATGRTHPPAPKKTPAKKFPDSRKDVAPPAPPDEPDHHTVAPPAKKTAKHTNTPANKDSDTQKQTDTSASNPVVIHDLPKGKKMIPVKFPDALADYPITTEWPINVKRFDDTHYDVNGSGVWKDGELVFSDAPGFVPPAKCGHVAVVYAIARFKIEEVKKMYPNVSMLGDD